MTSQAKDKRLHTFPSKFQVSLVDGDNHPARCGTMAPITGMLPSGLALPSKTIKNLRLTHNKLCLDCNPRPLHIHIGNEEYLPVMEGRTTQDVFCKSGATDENNHTVNVTQAAIMMLRREGDDLCRPCINTQMEAAAALESARNNTEDSVHPL